MAISRLAGLYPPTVADPYGYELITVPAGAVTINPGDNVASVMAANPAGTDYFFADGTFSTGLSGIVVEDGDRWYANPESAYLDGSSYGGQKVINVGDGDHLEVYYVGFQNWSVTGNHDSTIDSRAEGWGDDWQVGGNHPRWNPNPGSLLLYGVHFTNHTDSSPGNTGHAIQLGHNSQIIGGRYTGGANAGLCVNGHGSGIYLEGAIFEDWRSTGSGHHGIIKLVKVHNLVVRRCLFDNRANSVENTLLWVDVDVCDILIEQNEFYQTRGNAIHLELGQNATIRENYFEGCGNTNDYWGWSGAVLIATFSEVLDEGNEFVDCYGAIMWPDQSSMRNWGTEYVDGERDWTWDTRENGISPAPLNVAGADGEWGPNTLLGPGPGGTNYPTTDWVPIWGRIPTSADGSPTADHLAEYSTGGITARNNSFDNCTRTNVGGNQVPTIGARADHTGSWGATDSRAYKTGFGENEIRGNIYPGSTGSVRFKWNISNPGDPNHDNVSDAYLNLTQWQAEGFDETGTRTDQSAVSL